VRLKEYCWRDAIRDLPSTSKAVETPARRRALDRLRGLHYSVDPLTGSEYALPDEVRNGFVPTGQTSENDPSLKALAEALAQAAQAKADGRPWLGRFETSQGSVHLD